MTLFITATFFILAVLFLTNSWRRSRLIFILTMVAFALFTGAIIGNAAWEAERSQFLIAALMFSVFQLFFLFVLLNLYIFPGPISQAPKSFKEIKRQMDALGLIGSPFERLHRAVTLATYTVGPTAMFIVLLFGKRAGA